jgi:hypothetical protein
VLNPPNFILQKGILICFVVSNFELDSPKNFQMDRHWRTDCTDFTPEHEKGVEDFKAYLKSWYAEDEERLRPCRRCLSRSTGETGRILATENPTLYISVIVPGSDYHVQSWSLKIQNHTTRNRIVASYTFIITSKYISSAHAGYKSIGTESRKVKHLRSGTCEAK